MRKGLGCFFFCFFKFSLCFLAYQGIYKPQTYRNGEGLGVCLGATRYAHPPSSSSYLAGAAVRAPPGGVINGWWEWRSPQIDRQTLHKQAKGSTLGFPPGGGHWGRGKTRASKETKNQEAKAKLVPAIHILPPWLCAASQAGAGTSSDIRLQAWLSTAGARGVALLCWIISLHIVFGPPALAVEPTMYLLS